MVVEGLMTAVGVLKLLPEVVEISKGLWKKLKPPEELATGPRRGGISGNTYYSREYAFAVLVIQLLKI